MSEIEEPPAKVLKIDTIDGAESKNNATDTSLLETSTEQEEVHEEWLSEGILTDDDYNTASQEDQEDDDRTDSQLGSQGDLEEDNLDTSLESSTNDTKIHTDIQTVLDNLHKSIEEDQVEDSAVENAQNGTEIAQNGTENVEEIAQNVQENAEAENIENVLQISENEAEMSIDQSNVSDAHIELENAPEQETTHIEPEIEQTEPEIAQNAQEIAQNTLDTVQTESNINQDSEIVQNEQEIAQNVIENALNEQETVQIELNTEQNELENTNKPEILENLLITLENDDKNASEINTTAVIMDSQVKIVSSKIVSNSDLNEDGMRSQTVEQNIEETMKHLDGSKDDMNSDEFNELLLKKSDNEASEVKTKTEVKKDDDGNDTDDLLRMLGGDDNKTKKLTKTVKDLRRGKTGDDSSDDDDFVYEGPGVKKLKAAKSVISKKQPTKAVPEDFGDDEEYSSDHSDDTLKRMFKSNLVKSQNVRINQKHPAKHILNVVEKPSYMKEKSTPVIQYQNKNTKFNKSILKPTITTPKPAPAQKTVSTNNTIKMEVKKENKITFKPPAVTTPTPFKSTYKLKVNDDEYHDEQFLDDEQDDELDEDQLMDSEAEEISKTRQRIMRPEMMDEDVPSDAESYTEGSLYDEIPSSDSEDMDDWFTLDIRAEKAGDYIPLLGAKAKQLLLEEKERVATRLLTLKRSLTALTDSGKQQADQLRDATMTLAELDDMIKAS